MSASSMLFIFTCNYVMAELDFSEFSYWLAIFTLVGVLSQVGITYYHQFANSDILTQWSSIYTFVIVVLPVFILVYFISNQIVVFYYAVSIALLNISRQLDFFSIGLKSFLGLYVPLHILNIGILVFSIVNNNNLFKLLIPSIYASLIMYKIVKYRPKIDFSALFHIYRKNRVLLFGAIVTWLAGNIYLVIGTNFFDMPGLAGELRVVQLLFGGVTVVLIYFENLIAQRLRTQTTVKLYVIVFLICSSCLSLILMFAFFAEDIQIYLRLKFTMKYALLFSVNLTFAFLVSFFKTKLRSYGYYKGVLSAQITSLLISIFLAFPLLKYFQETGLFLGLAITQLSLYTLFRYYDYSSYSRTS